MIRSGVWAQGAQLSLLTLICLSTAAAQDLEFEAASVKPAPPPTGSGISRSMRGGPGSDDPGRVNYSNVTALSLITVAYNLKPYQVTGPDWVDAGGYDIVATIAPGATKEQFRLMLQKLLAERFHLTSHRETKVLPVYVLTVAKGGPKLKRNEDPEAKSHSNMSSGNTGMHLSGTFGTAQLAASLAGQLDRPVLDQTELPGLYDIDLSWVREEVELDQSKAASLSSGNSASSSVYAALQEKCGLKLEARKNPVEILVVDQLDKVPTGN